MSLRVVHVSCAIDPERRPPEALLDAWYTLPAVAAAASHAGAEITVIQTSWTDAQIERDGVSFRFVAEPAVRRAGLFPWRLTGAVRRAAPDVVHFNGLDFPTHARAVCGAGMPVLVQDHASTPQARIGRLRGWGYGRVAAASFTASPQAAPFIAAGQLAAEVPIFEIPESSTCFRPGDRAAARMETGIHGDPAVLWVGHLDSNKDPITILRAVRTALGELPGLHLWCAFAGTQLRPEIERLLADDRRLARHVHLLGRVSHAQVELACRASDFFMLGSHRESLGYALVEAMACGVVPVVSDIPAFRAVTGGAVGALVPVGYAEAFAAALVRLAQRDRRAMRDNVLDHFERHLSFRAVGARLVEAYSSLAAGAAR